MLYLNREQVDKLVEHSRSEAPAEACGILAGAAGKVELIYPMTNTDKSSKTFFMDPKEQLKVMKEIRNGGLEMIGIYHSHPATQAFPSAHDVELAFYPEASYVIVSLKDGENPDVRSFKVADEKVTEEEVRISIPSKKREIG